MRGGASAAGDPLPPARRALGGGGAAERGRRGADGARGARRGLDGAGVLVGQRAADRRSARARASWPSGRSRPPRRWPTTCGSGWAAARWRSRSGAAGDVEAGLAALAPVLPLLHGEGAPPFLPEVGRALGLLHLWAGDAEAAFRLARGRGGLDRRRLPTYLARAGDAAARDGVASDRAGGGGGGGRGARGRSWRASATCRARARGCARPMQGRAPRGAGDPRGPRAASGRGGRASRRSRRRDRFGRAGRAAAGRRGRGSHGDRPAGAARGSSRPPPRRARRRLRRGLARPARRSRSTRRRPTPAAPAAPAAGPTAAGRASRPPSARSWRWRSRACRTRRSARGCS